MITGGEGTETAVEVLGFSDGSLLQCNLEDFPETLNDSRSRAGHTMV